MKFSSVRPLTAVLAGLMILGVAGVASASAATGDGSIHACVDRKGGIRVVDAGAACRKKERPLAWQQQAPAAAQQVESGTCRFTVPRTVRAGQTVAFACRHQLLFEPNRVALTPGFSDAYAEDTYVLRSGLDYSFQVDWDTNNDLQEFVVLVRILRDIPAGGDAYGLLFSYLATGTPGQ